MKRLLKIEFLKIFSYANLWVLIGLHIGLFLIALFATSQIKFEFNGIPGIEFKNLFKFPQVWNTVSWLASFFNLILAILMITLVGNEFSFRTFRQNVIDGLSRKDLLVGKGLIIGVTALYSLVLVFVITLVVGFIYSGFVSAGELFEKCHYIIIYMVQTVAYMSFGLMVAMLIKNTALSIVAYFLYFFPGEPIVRNIFPDYIGRFFPMKVISNLTPMPEFISIGGAGQFSTSVNGSPVSMQSYPPPGIYDEFPLYINVLVALVYSTIFIMASYIIISRRKL